MFNQIVEASWGLTLASSTYEWWGGFTPLNVLIAIRSIRPNGDFFSFEIGPSGYLFKVRKESHLASGCGFSLVRVIVIMGKNTLIDPDPNCIAERMKLWVFGSKPLADLEWDPLEFYWQDPWSKVQGTPVTYQFFQYSVKVGRHIVQSSRRKILLLRSIGRHMVFLKTCLLSFGLIFGMLTMLGRWLFFNGN